MTALSDVRGGSVFGDALRITRLDASGTPLWGTSNMIQTDNLVKLDFGRDMQAGADITTVDAQGRACIVYRGRDTSKRSTITLDICDMDLQIHEMVLGGTLFTGADSRSFADGTTTSASPTLTSAADAAFTTADVGATVAGTGIPVGTTILSVQSATSATMSANATASGTVTVTITGETGIQGYQPPKVGEIGCPFGVSLEVWSKRIVGDFQVGWWHWALPRNFLGETNRSVENAAMAMSFTGWGNENPNWGSGPVADFNHDSSGLWQVLKTNVLPSPLVDGYQTIVAP